MYQHSVLCTPFLKHLLSPMCRPTLVRELRCIVDTPKKTNKLKFGYVDLYGNKEDAEERAVLLHLVVAVLSVGSAFTLCRNTTPLCNRVLLLHLSF